MLLVLFAEGFRMPQPNYFLKSDIDFAPDGTQMSTIQTSARKGSVYNSMIVLS